jgi:hypothetical protein
MIPDMVTSPCKSGFFGPDARAGSNIGGPLVLLRPEKLRHRCLPGVVLATSVPT